RPRRTRRRTTARSRRSRPAPTLRLLRSKTNDFRFERPAQAGLFVFTARAASSGVALFPRRTFLHHLRVAIVLLPFARPAPPLLVGSFIRPAAWPVRGSQPFLLHELSRLIVVTTRGLVIAFTLNLAHDPLQLQNVGDPMLRTSVPERRNVGFFRHPIQP